MRNWSTARAKVDAEARCRLRVDCDGPLDTAHVIGRGRAPQAASMDAAAVVPLCRKHHQAYDSHRLDLLPHLTLEEQAHAASLVGLAAAVMRTTGGRPLPAAVSRPGSFSTPDHRF